MIEGGEERGRNEDRLLGAPGSSAGGTPIDLAPIFQNKGKTLPRSKSYCGGLAGV